MKQKIIKIAQDLEQGEVTTKKARTLLLGLFGVSGSCSNCPMDEKPDVTCKHCGGEDIMFDHYFSDRCLDCGKHPTRD